MFADVPDMNYWCDLNCNAEIPFCPKTHCRCGDDDSGSHEVNWIKPVKFVLNFQYERHGFVLNGKIYNQFPDMVIKPNIRWFN